MYLTSLVKGVEKLQKGILINTTISKHRRIRPHEATAFRARSPLGKDDWTWQSSRPIGRCWMRSEEFLHQLMDVRLGFSTFGLCIINLAFDRRRVFIFWGIRISRFIKLPVCFVIVGPVLIDFIGRTSR